MRWREWIMLGLRVLSIFVADWYGGQNIRANAIDPHQFAHPVRFVRVRPPRPTAPAPAGAGGATCPPWRGSGLTRARAPRRASTWSPS